HRDRTAIFLGRIEFPDFHAFQRLFVETHAQRAHDSRTVYPAIHTNDDVEHHHALIFGLARLFRELGFWRIDRARRAHAVAHVINPRTYAGTAAAGAYPAAIAATDSASHANPVRRGHKFGERIANLHVLRRSQVRDHGWLDH